MVATRRGARTGNTEEQEEQDTSLTLRKKPVRRATAASTAKAAATGPKTRATRSKKPEPELEETAQPEKEQDELQEEPKPMPTRSTRSKRAETVEPEPARTTRATKPDAQPKRTVSTRKVEVAPDTQQAPATIAKPTLVARPTRQTRAKTPVAQAPLSPKKITQVSRVRTRGAASLDDAKQKPARNTRAASATQASRASRKRTVSDENAEIPDLRPNEPSQGVAAEQIEETSASTKATSSSKVSHVKEQAAIVEEQLSSRETMPSNSPGPVFEQPKDYAEDNIDAEDLEETEDEAEAVGQSASDDELSGPKTPMKRTSNSQSKYYTSARKEAARINAEVPTHTPPRRYGANSATRPTPQTQRPHDQATISDSVARPMTVARADSRPFVFRKLREDPESTPMPIASRTAEEYRSNETEAQADDQASRILTGEDMNTEMADAEDVQSQQAEDEEVEGHTAPQSDLEDTNIVSEGEANDNDESELIDSPTLQPPVLSYDVDDSMVDVDSSLIEPHVDGYEHEDSVMDSPTVEPPVASYEVDLDGSIIVHSRDDSDSEDCSEDGDEDQGGVTEFGLKTPRPETIPWRNIREDNTIPVDFDMHFADVRSPARDETDTYDGHVHVSGFADMQLDQFSSSPRDKQEAEAGAPDPTMNINDFIDMAALAEPTLQLDTVVGTSQDESLSEVNDDTENTVIITRAESLSLSPTQSAHEDQQAVNISTPAGPTQSRSPMEAPTQTTPMKFALDHEAADQTAGDVLEFVDDNVVPHYALPTLSSRRKSLPALGNQTPVRCNSRPVTSDGASIARVARPFDNAWMSRSRRSSTVGASTSATPVRTNFVRSMSSAKQTPAASDLGTSTPLKTKTHGIDLDARVKHFTPRGEDVRGYDQARTIAAPARFLTPGRSPVRRPATVQILGTQQQRPISISRDVPETPCHEGETSAEEKSKHVKTSTMPLRFSTPVASEVQSPSTTQKSTPQVGKEDAKPVPAHVSAATPQERFPRRSARQTYTEHASTVAAPARFHTPIQGKPRRPATTQKLASQNSLSKATPSQNTTPGQMPRGPSTVQANPKAATPSAATPLQRFPKLPPKDAYEQHAGAESVPLPTTPEARFPRRPPQQTYDERANTVVAPSRYRSPAQASPRRSATLQKPVNLRKVALKSSAPAGAHTPIKTPLKAPAMTPSQVPMTPHPGAPLRGVLALVEVFTLDGASASAPFISLLQRLGAKTSKSWSERVTHVIFKDGSPTTLQRVRLNNKEVETTGKGFIIHCVNSRWVSDCDATGSRVDEDDDAYAVDVTEVPRGGSRRRKSMEPSALVNIGGNIVRDRKSSGRQSIGRSSRVTSAEKKPEEEVPFTPGIKLDGLKDENDFDDDLSELATPDYLAAPDKLVQMTAPMNRVRKLDLKKDEAKNRRMTSFWEGGE